MKNQKTNKNQKQPPINVGREKGNNNRDLYDEGSPYTRGLRGSHKSNEHTNLSSENHATV